MQLEAEKLEGGAFPHIEYPLRFKDEYRELYYVGKNHHGHFLLKKDATKYYVYDIKSEAWVSLTNSAKRVMMDLLEKVSEANYLTADKLIELLATKFADVAFKFQKFNKSDAQHR